MIMSTFTCAVTGNRVRVADYSIEVIDMDGRRVDKVLVVKAAALRMQMRCEGEGVKEATRFKFHTFHPIPSHLLPCVTSSPSPLTFSSTSGSP